MAQGSLYAFRAAGTSPVYVLNGQGRSWVRGQGEAAQMQLDLTHVAILDASNALFLLPVVGTVPSAQAQAAYLAATGDQAIE